MGVTSRQLIGLYVQNAVQGVYLPNASSNNGPLPLNPSDPQTVEDLNRIQAVQSSAQPPDIRAAEDRVDLQDAQTALEEPGEITLDQVRARLNL
jgi:hypothetical protein